MRCCSGEAVTQSQWFLRCRHDFCPGELRRPPGQTLKTSVCQILCTLYRLVQNCESLCFFSAVLKNNMEPQKFNKMIAGVRLWNISSKYLLLVVVFYYYIGFKLSGVKLIHGDLNNLLSFRQQLRKTEDKGDYLLVALNTGRHLWVRLGLKPIGNTKLETSAHLCCPWSEAHTTSSHGPGTELNHPRVSSASSAGYRLGLPASPTITLPEVMYCSL